MREAKTEKTLEDALVDWVYLDEVDISEIDVEASLHNQARIDPPLYEDTVNQYAEAMADGAEFPALVGYYKDGKIVLIDGNHRVAGYEKNEIETIDVYIVDAAQDIIQALTYTMNASHGRPPTDEERLRHAIHLKDLGYTNKEAARVVSLTESKVAAEWAREQVRRRARRLGVSKPFESLTRELWPKINPIQSDNVFKAVVVFLAASKSLTRTESNNLVARVREQTTEETMLKVVEDFKDAKRDESRTEGRTRHRQNARQSLLPHLGYLVQADATAVKNSTLTQEQRDNVKSQLIKTVAFCNDLMRQLVGDDDETAEVEIDVENDIDDV